MKKFVIKNRRKRKYVRKKGENSEYTFSKTLYSMLPMLIMVIAFMATIIISTSFRDSFAKIRFTFQPPQISISDPALLLVTLSEIILTDVYHIFASIASAFGECIDILNPMPAVNVIGDWSFVFGNFIFAVVNVVIQAMVNSVNALAQLLSSVFFEVTNGVSLIISLFTNIFTQTGLWMIEFLKIAAQIIINALIFSIKIVLLTNGIILSAFLQIAIMLIKVITSVAIFAWTWIGFGLNLLLNFLGTVIHKIITAIEIPFKVLGAFGMRMRPYADMLGQHIEMTGKDFTNGLKDLGNVTSSMRPPK